MKMRCAVFIVLMVAGFVRVSFAERSPFEVPAVSKDRYNYAEALKEVTLKGVVSTEKGGCAVFERGGTEGEAEASMSIYKLGEKLTVVRDGLEHDFRVVSFDGKVVHLTAENKEHFEVTP
ncbi:hypothetical protein [Desulfoluna sp.]|uniref:hypothetical protein n=1 Tax=Desulfoluna sp. TaxID=2045199 RepID=UPI00260F99C4|nr:hypothetical protein [Desulfoluna sp.]